MDDIFEPSLKVVDSSHLQTPLVHELYNGCILVYTTWEAYHVIHFVFRLMIQIYADERIIQPIYGRSTLPISYSNDMNWSNKWKPLVYGISMVFSA